MLTYHIKNDSIRRTKVEDVITAVTRAKFIWKEHVAWEVDKIGLWRTRECISAALEDK